MAKPSIAARAREALAFARQLAREGKTWTAAMNAVYGLGGLCPELFPTREERTAFLKTKEHRQIDEVINALPDPPVRQEGPTEPPLIADIRVHLPRTLLVALQAEATARGIDLDQLIVTTLSRLVRTAADEERTASPRKKRA